MIKYRFKSKLKIVQEYLEGKVGARLAQYLFG